MNMDKLAVQWGYWATPRYGTEFPRVAAGFSEVKPNAEYAYKFRIEPISDELGMQIEDCVKVMKKVTPELYDVFVLTYVKRWATKEIYRVLGISRREYFNRVKTAKVSLKLMLSKERCIFVA